MPDDISLPKRKHPAHGIVSLPNQPVVIFDTICTKDRQSWLANESIHQELVKVWKEATVWKVGRYVIMPDHIHMFAAEGDLPIDYDNWVKYWKSQFSKAHQNKFHRWPTDHWDTRMRSENHMEEKWNYISYNPVRRGLVERPEDWPFGGEVFELRWS